MRKVIILLGVAAVTFTACGGSGYSTSSSSSQSTTASTSGNASQPVALAGTTNLKGTKTASGDSLDVELDDFYFKPTFVQGKPGQQLTLHLKNEGGTAHTFTASSLGVDQMLQPGGTADVSVTLPQTGATEFHCRFHQSSGMQGAFFFNVGDTLVGGATTPAGPTTTTMGSRGYPN